jgi:aerobic C4-dicarboxylate transport protein
LSEPTAAPARRPFYRDLSLQVLFAIACGVALGAFAPHVGQALKPLGDGFVRLVQMVVGPIVFCTVVHGIATVRDLGKVGRIAVKALIYFEVVTSIALVIGLVTANLFHPGTGLHVTAAALKGGGALASVGGGEPGEAAKSAGGVSDFLLNLIPNSAVGAFARGDILQILLFSVLFACGLASLGDKAKPVLAGVDAISKALFWVIGLVMKLAPIAAFGAMSFTIAKFGLASLISLGALIGEFYLTCALFILLVLAPVAAYAGVNLLKLMSYMREEFLLVLGTSSSESVFPQLTAKLERLGVQDQVVGLVLPTAYSFNHDGTCLYWAAIVVFLAQATGVPLDWRHQVGLLTILLLTSKGGAGVSGSAIAVLAMTLAATRTIPVGSIALVLGVHRVLSAAFVFTNIAGNCVATLVVGKWEDAIDRPRLKRELDAGFHPA